MKLALARLYGMGADQVFLSNGSDDILNFAFMAFGQDGAVFPNLTYSFYPVFADLHGVPYACTSPCMPDFTVDAPRSAPALGQLTVIMAIPNAPTGLALSRARGGAESSRRNARDHVVVIDEAYVDFGADSAAALVDRYPNLLVVMTYSKSRSMAGARLGFALGQPELIADLEKLKFSTNPYNVNRLTLKLGIAAVASDDYFRANAQRIMATRETTTNALRQMGFSIPDSQANFLFITHPQVDGAKLYQACKDKGVLIRHFSTPALAPYNRVTIGSEEEMAAFLSVVEEILAEEGV